MDLVFLPLMKHRWDEDEAARKVLELSQKIKDENMQSIVIAAVLGLADKYVRNEYIDRLKEVVRMTRIGASLIEEGRKEGRKEGKMEGKIDTVLKMIKKRFGKVPKGLDDKIKSADMDTLDRVIDGIMDGKTLEEIEAVLK
ncbi:DUF4351 domain-containing protein [Calorimonas adulescens]|uniref:DUF4351 domain-containing protein n=1 Tax=Calorimonas adulescens TaxID=2606906 RepID=A0A5D8Q873_9THEO|nr:DUF4351 domain-containing protein [Calorimonas adulescens]TZE80840.1 DUF4351 domain-containing protein [Calorimonas adulescens]